MKNNDFDMFDQSWDDHKSTYDRMQRHHQRTSRIETVAAIIIILGLIVVYAYLSH